jgi:hypothetical protein
LKRLIVTYNAKDFRELATRSQESGVIAVSANMPFHQVDTKRTALLIRNREKALLGKFTLLTGETSVSSRLTPFSDNQGENRNFSLIYYNLYHRTI